MRGTTNGDIAVRRATNGGVTVREGPQMKV